MLLAWGGNAVAGQPDESRSGAGADTPRLTDAEQDPDGSLPLAFRPQTPRTFAAAELPPSSVLLGGSLSHNTSIVFGHDWRAGRDEYRAIIEREALANGLPPAMLDAVMAVESHYNPAVIGFDGEIGLMQLLPSTARMLGFSGSDAQLATPEINIHYGARYLAGAWRLAREDVCTATMKYRAGHGETRFSFRSVEYCVRVRSHLAAHGVVVSGTVPQPTFGISSGGISAGGRSTGSALAGGRTGARGRSLMIGGKVDYVALNTRMRALTDALHATR